MTHRFANILSCANVQGLLHLTMHLVTRSRLRTHQEISELRSALQEAVQVTSASLLQLRRAGRLAHADAEVIEINDDDDNDDDDVDDDIVCLGTRKTEFAYAYADIDDRNVRDNRTGSCVWYASPLCASSPI